ncbi:uncharacterized protein VP01_186g8 [Puccinia sorghi]|uniref:CCHC-type domain-containing protein n=1 Tax=Puccinia sorghi TaxID=27349 RepID=A0A0L6VF47_9BASI|nr:uncharacterized protein VP01_186g8 [Puccinia sorghi]
MRSMPTLTTMAGQQNPAPAQPNPAPAPASNPMVIAKPQLFDGTRGATAKAFIGQIGLHAVTYPKRFPSNTSKVVFAVLFMRYYTETWSQPYLDKILKKLPVVFDEFLNNFRSSFFDQNCWHCAKVALQNIRQTVALLSYTQDFNQHTCTVGWANTPLISLYQHALKRVRKLKESNKTSPPPKAPNNRLSDAKQAHWVQWHLCFRCSQVGHISRRCLNGGQRPQECPQPPYSAWISELQA